MTETTEQQPAETPEPEPMLPLATARRVADLVDRARTAWNGGSVGDAYTAAWSAARLALGGPKALAHTTDRLVGLIEYRGAFSDSDVGAAFSKARAAATAELERVERSLYTPIRNAKA